MRARYLRRRQRDESGAVAIMFALLLVVLVGLAALGTDVGNMVSRRTETQASADFAAFAAAHELNQTARAGTAPSTEVVEAVRDYLNNNQPQDDELTCAQTQPGTCVESADLIDLDLGNGEVRYTADGLQVVAPQTRVDFGLAGIFGVQGTYVDATATVNVFSGGQRVMPMFAVSACDYGRQTLTDPATGHVAPGGVPELATSDSNPTLTIATLTNSAGSTVTELQLNSTGNMLTLTASGWDKSKKIGFFQGDNVDPAFAQTQPVFWLQGDASRADLSPDPKPAGMTDSDWDKVYKNSGSSTVQAMIPDTVAQTEGIWWVRVFNGPDATGKWSREALPIRVGGAVLECTAGSTDGNFGTLKLPRTDVPTGSELPVNIAVGLQAPLTPAVHDWAVDHPLEAGTCSDTVNGAVESFGTTLRPATNCVDTDTGLAANIATQGLITGVATPSGSYPGMLTTRATKTGCDPAGGSADRTKRISGRDYTNINNDVLTCYLTNDTTSLADIASASYAGGPVLDEDIYSAPRFIWIPVLKVQPDSGGSQRYSIVDFRPGFITDEAVTTAATRGSRTATADNGLTIPSNDITQIKVVFFNVNALPTDGDFPTIDFLGVGTPKIKLID